MRHTVKVHCKCHTYGTGLLAQAPGSFRKDKQAVDNTPSARPKAKPMTHSVMLLYHDETAKPGSAAWAGVTRQSCAVYQFYVSLLRTRCLCARDRSPSADENNSAPSLQRPRDMTSWTGLEGQPGRMCLLPTASHQNTSPPTPLGALFILERSPAHGRDTAILRDGQRHRVV